MVNLVVLEGRVAGKPFVKEGGVVNFLLAVTERRKKDGEWVDQTQFVPVTRFKMSEKQIECLSKGKLVSIQGSVSVNTYTTKEGVEIKNQLQIIAHTLNFLGSSSKEGNSSEEKKLPDEETPIDETKEEEAVEISDEDMDMASLFS